MNLKTGDNWSRNSKKWVHTVGVQKILLRADSSLGKKINPGIQGRWHELVFVVDLISAPSVPLVKIFKSETCVTF